MWAVVVEWGGSKPPNRYYRRLARLTGGASARGNRAALSGVIVQESVVIVPSLSLAEAVALLVEDAAADFRLTGVEVWLAPLELRRPDVPPEVTRRWAALDGQLSIPGRPPDEKRAWVVTCFECARAGEVTIRADYSPRQCPHCGGLRVWARPGKLAPVMVTKTGNLWTHWLQARFSSTGHFEPAKPVAVSIPPAPPDIREQAEAEAVRRIAASGIPEALRGLPEEVAMRFLDGLVCALAHIPAEERREARLRFIAEYYIADPCAQTVLPIAPEAEVDLLEAAVILREELTPWVRIIR